jgi:hypothetical protein
MALWFSEPTIAFPSLTKQQESSKLRPAHHACHRIQVAPEGPYSKPRLTAFWLSPAGVEVAGVCVGVAGTDAVLNTSSEPEPGLAASSWELTETVAGAIW